VPAQLSTEQVADFGDDLDLGRLIELRIFELVNGVLVIEWLDMVSPASLERALR